MKCKVNKCSTIKYLTVQNRQQKMKIKQLEDCLKRGQKLLPDFIVRAQIAAYNEVAKKFENELDQKVEEWYFEEQHENFMSANKVLAFHDNMINELIEELIKGNVYDSQIN